MPLLSVTPTVHVSAYQVPRWADGNFTDLSSATRLDYYPQEPSPYPVPHWAEYNFVDYQEDLRIPDECVEPAPYPVPRWAEGAVDLSPLLSWQVASEHGGGPFVDMGNVFPSPDSEDVSLTTSIVVPSGYWYTELDTRLLSFRGTGSYGPQNSGVDDSKTTIRVQYGSNPIDAEFIYMSGSAQNGWGVTLTESNVYGIVYEMAKALPPLTTIFIEITLYDFYGRRYRSVFSFTTTTSAKIIPEYPIPDQVSVSPSSPIVFTIVPSVFKKDSVVVEVDRGEEEGFIEAFNSAESEKFKNGWDGPLSSVTDSGGVYRVVLDPWGPLPKNKTVTVKITATDYSGTHLTLG